MEDSSDILLNITSESLKNIDSFQEKKYENISPIIKIESTDYTNLISEEGNALVYVLEMVQFYLYNIYVFK